LGAADRHSGHRRRADPDRRRLRSLAIASGSQHNDSPNGALLIRDFSEDLRDIRLFIAVYKKRSFTAAEREQAPVRRIAACPQTHARKDTLNMQYRPFGPAGDRVSVIGMGTWHIDVGDRKTAVAALQAGLDAGVNHIDTAEMYGDAELVVAEAIAGRRDEVFLVSKVLPHNASREGTRTACERSLKRLGTDRLDCYLLHWRGPHPLADTVAAFTELQREGKIRSWGVSNLDEEDLAELDEAAGRTGGRNACDQVLYHLKERAIEHAVLPACKARSAALVAYSPFGHDDFPRPDSPGGKVLAAIAETHRATPRQAALAFLIRDPAVFAIPKAGSPKHAIENAAAAGIALSPDEIAEIDRAFPLGRRPRSLPML
jgi:diketogulonate reductase-like aldo/keto reductase